MKTESWLRIIRRLCEIDEWLSIHMGWFHNTGLWMPVYQWMHAELVVWEYYWEKQIIIKKVCGSCKLFGPEVFLGCARCQLLGVVLSTCVLTTDIVGSKDSKLSVQADFGCILWEQSPHYHPENEEE